MVKRKNPNGGRKIQILVMLSNTELKWLEKRKMGLNLKSRSAVIRHIINKDMEKQA